MTPKELKLHRALRLYDYLDYCQKSNMFVNIMWLPENGSWKMNGYCKIHIADKLDDICDGLPVMEDHHEAL
jgi:hypothetical protein